jgi:membrane protein required for colicin V production
MAALARLDAFDWALVGIVLLSMYLAFRRGLVRAIMGLLGFVAGFALASFFYIDIADHVNRRWIHSDLAARTLSFLLIVVIVVLGFDVLGRIVQRALRLVGLGPVDRLLGAAFGFVRGCFFCLALLMAITTFDPQSETVVNSVLTPYLFAAAHDVSFLVPQYIQVHMVNGAFDFKQNIQH